MFFLLWLDWRIEASTKRWAVSHRLKEGHGSGGVGLIILLMIILPLATYELAALFTAERIRPYRTIAGLGSGCLVLHAFLTQFHRFRDIAASTLAFGNVAFGFFAILRRVDGLFAHALAGR